MKAILLSICSASFLFASIGQITAVRGDAWLVRGNETQKAHQFSKLEVKDTIKTASNSVVQVEFVDKTRLTLGKNSSLDINEYLLNGHKSKVFLSANAGSYMLTSGQIGKLARQNFHFKAQTLSIGIRGTNFVGELNGSGGGKVACASGAIELNINGQKQLLNAGQQADYELGELMHIDKFQPSDFELLNSLGVHYHEPKAPQDFINNKHQGIKIQHKKLDYKQILKSSPSTNDSPDELDKLMGF